MTDSLREKLREVLNNWWLYSNKGKDDQGDTNYWIDQIEQLYAAHDEQVALSARIDEADMALQMKGKVLVHGVLLDHTQFGDTNPDAIDSSIVALRKQALEQQLEGLRGKK